MTRVEVYLAFVVLNYVSGALLLAWGCYMGRLARLDDERAARSASQ